METYGRELPEPHRAREIVLPANAPGVLRTRLEQSWAVFEVLLGRLRAADEKRAGGYRPMELVAASLTEAVMGSSFMAEEMAPKDLEPQEAQVGEDPIDAFRRQGADV